MGQNTQHLFNMKKMNFKKLLKYTLSGMAIIPMLSACNSDTDFLTEKPETIYTPENAYETVDQVKACVTNLYVHIRYWYDVDQFLKGLGSDVADTPIGVRRETVCATSLTGAHPPTSRTRFLNRCISL